MQRDRTRQRQLGQLLAARRATEAAAQAAEAAAHVVLDQARFAEQQADAAMATGEMAWRDLLARPGFHPQILAGHARALVNLAATRDDASYATTAAAASVAACEAERRQQMAEVRALGDLHRQLGRRIARTNEERLAQTSADRVSMNWRRP